MKNINMTQSQAIAIMRSLLCSGCAIPMASIGNSGSGFAHVGPILMDKDTLWYVSQFKGKTFRVVPTSEVSVEFSDCDLNYYDVCVEFTNATGDYSEQFLLWDIDYIKY